MHHAVNKLHWSPSQIKEWFDAEQSVRAFYYASIELKAKHDEKEAAKIPRKGKRKGRR